MPTSAANPDVEAPPLPSHAEQAPLASFLERCELALLGAQNGLAHLALLLLELDPPPAPTFLPQLRQALRRGDMLTVLAPNRYVVLFEGLASEPEADARRLATKLIETFTGVEVRIGLVVHRSGHSASAAALLDRAQASLDAARPTR
ncbi:hypothetical protein [Chitinimonas lacunae]|uniref:GGDEF domain-containing protein n=1 Tax=Chitinimonas lacunae TaxID=1963018 RepID=A0ABV8MSJ0_9NEIS